ncbi:MAG: hypothetical protein QX196_08515 [Methylococcaceae bacterium]
MLIRCAGINGSGCMLIRCAGDTKQADSDCMMIRWVVDTIQ